MPGRLFLAKALGDAGLGQGPAPETARDLNIAPGQDLACLTATGWRMMRWGLIPQGRTNARGRPVLETLINARSETVFDKSAFAGVQRCIVPVTGWYEWTGAARRKQAWSLQQADGSLCLFAGVFDVWTAPGGRDIAQMATVTCAPNADVAPIHHRMGVLLDPDHAQEWVSGSEDAARTLMHPWPENRLRIEKCADPNRL